MRLVVSLCLFASGLFAGGFFAGRVFAYGAPPASAANYPEALQKSLFFYEAQRSGPLPATNRVSWRGDSGLSDGADHQVDLVGGFHDAGDHVKFAFPLAYTTTILAWSLQHDRQAYTSFQQLPYAEANLRAMTDWLLKAHTAPNELWAQVGDGNLDHAFWGAPEVMAMPRPSYKIDASCPGTDLAAEAAAALASASLALRPTDAAYADQLVGHAKQLYAFADQYRGKYSDCLKEVVPFYNSWSGFQDELVWGAAWLYKATGDAAYLAKAELEFQPYVKDLPRKDTLSWDDKIYGSYVLLAELTGKELYEQAAVSWLDYWSGDDPAGHVQKSPGGLAWISQWGPLRYAASTAMMALYFGEHLTKVGKLPAKAQAYTAFAKQQIDYMLGLNPAHYSFVIGYGERFPKNPHHRAAHGSWSNNLQLPQNDRHIIYGALVGGPNQDDSYEDNRGNYAQSEVALDYNAAFTGCAANLASRFGGQIDPQFPPHEAPVGEFLVQSRVNATGPDFVEIATKLLDRAAYPARFSQNLAFRYFISLAGIPPAERNLSDIKITTAYDQSRGGVSGVKVWDEQRSIYYVEVSFHGQSIGPIGDWESTREVQFRFTTPAAWRGRFDPRAGWSAERGGGGDWDLNEHIALYEGDVLRSGATPP